MTLAQVICAMRAAGCTDDQIDAVVCGVDERRRAKARDGNRRRQAKLRQTRRNGNNAVTQRDIALQAVTGRDEDGTRARVHNLAEVSTIPPVDPNGSTSPKGDGDRKRGTRLDEAWEPSVSDIEFAKKLGYSSEQIQLVAEEFRNYWLALPGQKARKLDWSRTFKNRLSERASRIVKEVFRPVLKPQGTGFLVKPETPEKEAWDEYSKRTKGKGIPSDRDGNWWVPTQWPPGHTSLMRKGEAG